MLDKLNEKLKEISLFKILLAIIFSISFSCLSIQLMTIKNENLLIILTTIISFPCGMFLFLYTFNYIKNNIEKNEKLLYVFLLLISIIYFGFCKFQTVISLTLISAIALIYIGILIGYNIEKWIVDFYKEMNSWDKKAYVITSIICAISITVLYINNQGWFLQYDKVYSIDSGWCFKRIFPLYTYYDIRHPLLGVFAFPIYTLASFPNLFFDSENLLVCNAIIMQFINSQFLIIIALELKKILNNKHVFITYMISFPTILFLLFFEKYQLCIFLLVTYVYQINKNKDTGKMLLISSFGLMFTNAFAGISEFFTKSKVEEKVLNVMKIMVISISMLICCGRISCFKYGIKEIQEMKLCFAAKEYSFKEKLFSTTNMFDNTIFALPSEYENRIYLWKDILNNISYIGIAIILICFLGFCVNRKKMYSKIFISWTGFASILFFILNWSVHESPLFSIYFSWAVIPLLIMGIDYIIKKLRIKRIIIYIPLYIAMITINIVEIINITKIL